MCLHHILFICLFLDGRLDRFHHLARVNSAAVSMCVPCISGLLKDSSPLGCPEVVWSSASPKFTSLNFLPNGLCHWFTLSLPSHPSHLISQMHLLPSKASEGLWCLAPIPSSWPLRTPRARPSAPLPWMSASTLND